MPDISYPPSEISELWKWLAGTTILALVQLVYSLVQFRKLEAIRKEITMKLHEYQVYTSEKVKKRYEVLESVYHSVLEADFLSYRIINEQFSETLRSDFLVELERIKRQILPKSIYLEKEDYDQLTSIFSNVFKMIESKHLLLPMMLPKDQESSTLLVKDLSEAIHKAYQEVKESKQSLFNSFRSISLQTAPPPSS